MNVASREIWREVKHNVKWITGWLFSLLGGRIIITRKIN
jgi:hypothetical protein